MQWIERERRGTVMLKQCTVCGRYFDHEVEEICERCQKPAKKAHVVESKRICECGNSFAPFHEHDHTCPDCKRQEFNAMDDRERNRVYMKVRDFLYAYPLTPKVKVSERFGVPIKFIDEWVSHGKIEEIDEVDLRGGGPENVCRYCGVKTHKGKICKQCEARLGEKLESHNNNYDRTQKYTRGVRRK